MINMALDLKTIVYGFLVIVGLPTLITFLALLFTNKNLDTSVLLNVFIVALVLWAVGVAFSWNNYIKYDNDIITVKAGFHSKKIIVKSLEKVSVIKLSGSEVEKYRIKYKSLGTSFPRYHMGSFVLQNGLKAFLLIIGNSEELVLISYEDNYILTNLTLPEIKSIFNENP